MTARRKAVSRSSRDNDRDRLVRELAGFLADPPTIDQPRLLRNSISPSGLQEITVLWDRWKGIPFSERSSIILQAYDQLPDSSRAAIAYAIGRTTDEAIELGYFPYKITLPPFLPEAGVQDRIEQAMRAERAIATNEGLELRFTNIQDAYDTYMRLQQRVPGPFWAITKEEYVGT